jgi:hypothetical protein
VLEQRSKLAIALVVATDQRERLGMGGAQRERAGRVGRQPRREHQRGRDIALGVGPRSRARGQPRALARELDEVQPLAFVEAPGRRQPGDDVIEQREARLAPALAQDRRDAPVDARPLLGRERGLGQLEQALVGEAMLGALGDQHALVLELGERVGEAQIVEPDDLTQQRELDEHADAGGVAQHEACLGAEPRHAKRE